MRILCVADIHDNEEIRENVESLTKKKKIDVVINAGDFLSKDFAEDMLNETKVKTFVVLGNWDPGIKTKNKNVSILVNEVEKYKGYHFMGVDMRAPIKRGFNELANRIPSDKLIFITHEPPFGILDFSWFGSNAGLAEYRGFVEEKKPLMYVFGHIHESAGYAFYGDTLVINASVLELRRAYIVDIPEMKITWVRV